MVNSVSHAVRILELFAGGRTLGLTEVVQQTNLPRATTHRILQTLTAHELLIHDCRKYRLSLRLLELATSAFTVPALQELVQPVLASLVERTQETAHFAVLDGFHVGYVTKLDSPHPIRMLSSVGWRGPLHATAVGKALLAAAGDAFVERALQRKLEPFTTKTITQPEALRREVSRIREQGYALDDEELLEGLVCVAVAIPCRDRLMGALSLSGPKQRFKPQRLANFIDALHDAKQTLCRMLTLSSDGDGLE